MPGPHTFLERLKLTPVIILKLFVVQFFTWIGLFALWIYALPVISRHIFKTVDSASADFEKSVSWVGYCFAFYSVLAACLAFLIPRLTKRLSIFRLHAFALLIGSVGFFLVYVVQNKWMLFIAFIFIAIGWSSISNIPYRMVSEVVEEEEKLTFYMSLFSFSVVIPQVFAAILLGLITRYIFAGDSLYTILTGGFCMLLAGLIMLFIQPVKASTS